MEHGHGGISEALPESSTAWAKNALDLGPQGLMFQMIDDPELAEKAVSYCRYPPNGVRGAAHPIVRASKYGIDEEYIKLL